MNKDYDMIIRHIEPEDVSICVEWIYQELIDIGLDNDIAYKRSRRLGIQIENEKGYVIVDNTNKLCAFLVIDENEKKDEVEIISMFCERNNTAARYALFNLCSEVFKNRKKVYHFKIDKGMRLPINITNGHIANVKKLDDFLEKTKDRYGRYKICYLYRLTN